MLIVVVGNRQAKDRRRNFSLPPTAPYRRADLMSNSGCRTQLRVRQEVFGAFSQMTGFATHYYTPLILTSQSPFSKSHRLPSFDGSYRPVRGPRNHRGSTSDHTCRSPHHCLTSLPQRQKHTTMQPEKTAWNRYLMAHVTCHIRCCPFHATRATTHRI